MNSYKPSQAQSPHSPKMHLQIQQRAYGKPTKNRTEEPSMFQLLTWQNNSLNRKDFKKNTNFNYKQVPEAYMQQLQRQSGKSQAKENYTVPDGTVQVDQGNLYKVQNYLYAKQGKQIKKQQQAAQLRNVQFEKNAIPYGQDRNMQKKPTFGILGNGTAQQPRKNMKRVPSPDIEHQRNNQKPSTNFRPLSPQPHTSQSKPLLNNKNTFGYNQSQLQETTQDQQIKQRQKLIEKFKQTTRWIPNSSFTTYFGKPPFENYGYGNVKPTKGGLVYGTYLYSHNVHPHRGMNSPKSMQSYPVALNKAKSQGTLVPFPPKTKNPDFNTSSQGIDSPKKFSNINIYPQPNMTGKLDIEAPNLMDIEKFGGTGYGYTSPNGHRQPLEMSSPNIHSRQDNLQKPKKKKSKGSQKKVGEHKNQKNEYEDWIALKQQQKKNRPTSPQYQQICGKKVHY